MTLQQFSLSWEKHQSNICNGFRDFQLNGDFVDMTLAAEGHHVKVHKMMMGVASTYFRSLISTADSKHPIVFLHNISYETLLSLLEFIYTGEVAVQEDKLVDFINTAQKLQISGLLDMNEQSCQSSKPASQVLSKDPSGSEHKKVIDSLFLEQVTVEHDVGVETKPALFSIDPLGSVVQADLIHQKPLNELRNPHLQHTRQGTHAPDQSGTTKMFGQLSLGMGNNKNWDQGQGNIHVQGYNQGRGQNSKLSVQGSGKIQGLGHIQGQSIQGSGNIQGLGNKQSVQGQGQCVICPRDCRKLTSHMCVECSQWACPGHLTHSNVCANCTYNRVSRACSGKTPAMWD